VKYNISHHWCPEKTGQVYFMLKPQGLLLFLFAMAHEIASLSSSAKKSKQKMPPLPLNS
jgi:hypothetical protein